MRAPHLEDGEVIEVRRGFFWITGERVATPTGLVMAGPMHVEWEAPARPTELPPLVLVHGGGGQATDWWGTPDGRPGWARRFVDAGHPVYVVDRPGHGRSPHHPDVLGRPGPQFSYEAARFVFVPALEEAPDHTEWPWSRDPGGEELDQFMCGVSFQSEDIAAAQLREAERLGRLLERVGPAVLVTHSAAAPCGWIAANEHPGLVRALVAIEPQSPPFSSRSGIGDMEWGITRAPIRYDPPASSPDKLERPLPGRRLPGLVGLDVAVVTGGASAWFRETAPQMVEFLRDAGAHAEHLDLAAHGVLGNGHAIMLERNSDEAIVPVLAWIREHG